VKNAEGHGIIVYLMRTNTITYHCDGVGYTEFARLIIATQAPHFIPTETRGDGNNCLKNNSDDFLSEHAL
jgi:hypothetical protein